MQTVQPSRALGTVGTVGIMGFVERWRRSLKPTCESTGESILTMPWHCQFHWVIPCHLPFLDIDFICFHQQFSV
jgi:hypothetical protein